METQFYTRISIAGWLFIGVLIGTLWGSNSPQWNSLVQLAQSKADITVAVFSIVAGVSAPPVLGLVFERLASLLMYMFKQNMWNYSSMTVFGSSMVKALAHKNAKLDKVSDGALFHVFFYTHADEKLIDWARRRRTQMYVSMTSCLAIVSAMLLSLFAFKAFALSVGIISLLLAAAFLVHGLRENHIHEEAISAWSQTIGGTIIREFVLSEKNILPP